MSSLELDEPRLGPASRARPRPRGASSIGPGVKALSRDPAARARRRRRGGHARRGHDRGHRHAHGVSLPMNPFHLIFDRPFTWAVEHAPTGHAAVRRPRASSHREERLMRYHSLGRIPAKRHVQFRDPDASATARAAARRGGHGLRGLLRQRVDPLPPVLALPGQGRRRLHEDRARGVGARHPRPPAHPHARAGAARRQRRSAGASCSTTTTSRSGSASPSARRTTSTATARATRSSSSTRARASSRRLRDAPVPQARLRRHPARHDLPLPLRRAPALADLLHAGRDRDPEPLPQPLRPAARARAVLPARLPPAGRAA